MQNFINTQDTPTRKLPTSHLLLVDKPTGVSSYNIVARAQKTLQNLYKNALIQRYQNFQNTQPPGASSRVGKKLKKIKIGHGGTLDPFATGVLVLGIEQGTKLLDKLLKGNKVYECTASFGTATETQDLTGRICEQKSYKHIAKNDIKNTIDSMFIGNITQTPPIYSALKHKGKPLYLYARKGKPLDIKPRPALVHSFEILTFHPPKIRFRIKSGAGVYIRTLIHDLAHSLGTCAHLTQLQRVQCGRFKLENTIPAHYLDTLGDKLIQHLKNTNTLHIP